MTQGKIDLKVVQDRLAVIREYMDVLRILPTDSPEIFMADPRNAASAESLLRRAIEALLDIARHLLARGFGRSSLEYRQTAELAIQQGLILDPEIGKQFLKMAGYRNRLTHLYAEVTSEELYTNVRDYSGDIEKVAEELRQAVTRIGALPPTAPTP